MSMTAEKTVRELALENPAATRVFEKLGIAERRPIGNDRRTTADGLHLVPACNLFQQL